MSLTTPTADIKLSFVPDGQGNTVVDVVLTPGGDLAFVQGTELLRQNVLRWLLTPQGSNAFDPSYGNPMWSMLARPTSGLPDDYLALVQQAQTVFIQQQAVDAAQGWLSLDEQVDHFENTTVQVGGSVDASGVVIPPGTIVISFTIVTRSGISVPSSLTFDAPTSS